MTDEAAQRRDYPTLIRGGSVVVPGDDDVLCAVPGDLLMEGERIAGLGTLSHPPRDARIIYAGGCAVLPGFVQSHVHLSHSLFRGLLQGVATRAELGHRLLTLEAAHTAQSARAGARLAVAELLLGGTTAVQAMESVHHTDAILEVLVEAGLYALAGKSLIDADHVPAGLAQPTERALREAVDLAESWDGAGDGRLRVCLAPRTVASCTDACLHEVGRLADVGGWRVQLEAAGSPVDVEDPQAELETLARHGLLGAHLGLAHCASTPSMRRLLADTGVHLLYCPASDARRGLDTPMLAGLQREGLEVSLGTDGAAVGGSLDAFQQLHLMVLLQQAASGPDALAPPAALEIATRAGAAALGRSDELGELREGAVANVVLVSLEGTHTTPCPDPVEALAHGARSADIRAVWLAGRQVVSEGRLTLWDEDELRRDARREARGLTARAGL